MNQLNEKLRIIRIQIQAEKKKEKPDIEKLKSLRKVERSCLKQLMK